MKRLLHYLKNKYIIATILFAVIIIAVDENNLIVALSIRHEVNELKEREAALQQSITNDSIRILSLAGNRDAVERYGREAYYMKRADEDIYIVTDE